MAQRTGEPTSIDEVNVYATYESGKKVLLFVGVAWEEAFAWANSLVNHPDVAANKIVRVTFERRKTAGKPTERLARSGAE
jgi:hypothetical protein